MSNLEVKSLPVGMGVGDGRRSLLNVSSHGSEEKSEGVKHVSGGTSLSSADMLIEKNRFSYDFRGGKVL